ncbi:MAG TPA: hypothetical protein V6C78_14640 [Crinalium sp.]|jgi:hypothetical protein
MDEQARQFQVQTEMFKELGVKHPQQRSPYFSSALQGTMLMYSTYPTTFPLDAVKVQIIAEFYQNPHEMHLGRLNSLDMTVVVSRYLIM